MHAPFRFCDGLDGLILRGVSRDLQISRPNSPFYPLLVVAYAIATRTLLHGAAFEFGLDDIGQPRKAFHYVKKGIMAMIGRRSAAAELGVRRHHLPGVPAFFTWLGVHVAS